jgi:hypothetical protein
MISRNNISVDVHVHGDPPAGDGTGQEKRVWRFHRLPDLRAYGEILVTDHYDIHAFGPGKFRLSAVGGQKLLAF